MSPVVGGAMVTLAGAGVAFGVVEVNVVPDAVARPMKPPPTPPPARMQAATMVARPASTVRLRLPGAFASPEDGEPDVMSLYFPKSDGFGDLHRTITSADHGRG